MTDFNNFNYREINATQSNFIGFVSNGKIYNSFNQQIGVTNDEYKKAIDTAESVYDTKEFNPQAEQAPASELDRLRENLKRIK